MVDLRDDHRTVARRATTIEVELVRRPESDDMLRAILMLGKQLQLTVELASPDLCISVPAGWEHRSPVMFRIGQVTFRRAVDAMFPPSAI